MKGPKGHWVTLSQPSNMLFKSHWAMGRCLICLYIVFQLHTVPLRNSHPSPIPSPLPPPIVCIKEGGAQPLKLEQYIRTAYEAVSLCYMTCNLLLSSLWVLKALDEACMLHQLSNKDLDASKMVIFREKNKKLQPRLQTHWLHFPGYVIDKLKWLGCQLEKLARELSLNWDWHSRK